MVGRFTRHVTGGIFGNLYDRLGLWNPPADHPIGKAAFGMDTLSLRTIHLAQLKHRRQPTRLRCDHAGRPLLRDPSSYEGKFAKRQACNLDRRCFRSAFRLFTRRIARVMPGNRLATSRAALSSEVECIVSDNASGDATSSVIAKYQQQFPLLRAHRNPTTLASSATSPKSPVS